jgi:hypothetical protein
MGKRRHGWDGASAWGGPGPTGGTLAGKLARAPLGPSGIASLYECSIHLQVY